MTIYCKTCHRLREWHKKPFKTIKQCDNCKNKTRYIIRCERCNHKQKVKNISTYKCGVCSGTRGTIKGKIK